MRPLLFPALLMTTFTACADPVGTEFSDGGPGTQAVTGMTYDWAFDQESPGPNACAGVIGLWTKADSITRFDELSATAR